MEKRNRVLLIVVHPAMEHSRLNAALLEELSQVADVTVRDLYQIYPYFMIDVAAEQALLLSHDVIVFQHPFYWYSVPALMKQWMEATLAYEFAYGQSGTALQGKVWLNVLTTGAAESSYSETGLNQMTIWELLAPLRATAHLCGMVFLPPAVFFQTTLIRSSAESLGKAKDAYRALLHNLQVARLSEMKALEIDNSLDWRLSESNG